MKLQETIYGTIIDVHVKPRSRQFKIEINDARLIVYCREAPVKGKVNKELIKELSKFFKKKAKILSGFTSRNKKILIKDADETYICARINSVS